MSDLTPQDIADLRVAARTFFAENIGDKVYDIRERELKGWEGPRVKAWGEACLVLQRLAQEGKL